MATKTAPHAREWVAGTTRLFAPGALAVLVIQHGGDIIAWCSSISSVFQMGA